MGYVGIFYKKKNIQKAYLLNKMLFLTNEPAKKTEINILTARDTTGPGY